MAERTSQHIRDEAVRLYAEEDVPGYAISRQLGISPTSVYRWVKEAGFEISPRLRRTWFSGPRKLRQHLGDVIERYQSGEGAKTIGASFGVSSATVLHLLRCNDIAIRGRGGQRVVYPDELVETVARQWLSGDSQEKIGRNLGLSQPRVSAMLRTNGFTKADRHARGDRHGSWTGGRTVTSGGYIYVRLEPGDPHMPMATSAGYIAEHRLTMAKDLGRLLSPRESVHHINGVKGDNRIENLQLRQGQHGNGVRHRCADCGSFNVVMASLA